MLYDSQYFKDLFCFWETIFSTRIKTRIKERPQIHNTIRTMPECSANVDENDDSFYDDNHSRAIVLDIYSHSYARDLAPMRNVYLTPIKPPLCDFTRFL